VKVKPLIFVWCVLICDIYGLILLNCWRLNYYFLAALDSSRWFHFIIYTIAATIPLVVLKKVRYVIASFVPLAIAVAAEAFRSDVSSSALRSQTVPADLFGFAAGILLGLNICTLRRSTKALGNGNREPRDG
jgi:hypothetical protein